MGMNTVNEVFKAFDDRSGTSALAKVLKVKLSAASEMRRRGSIPVRYWPLLVAESERRSLPISYDVLVRIHAKARGKQKRSQPASAA